MGVDVGSLRRPGGFSWATPDGQDGADDPSALGAVVVSALNEGRSVALALECPLSVPVPGDEEWKQLGRGRMGEGNRPWSAGAGAAVLTTGLVQLAWLCQHVVEHCSTLPRTTTQLSRFLSGEAELLLAEAMVTSDGKPKTVDRGQDHEDALAAAQRLAGILTAARAGEAVETDVSCSQGALNLAATSALHAGLPIASDELRLDVLVAKVRPETSS
ncbi:hypothetical protein EK0264_14130 [Epidermidibacterium keratini]|uniref:Uncharacterized protein n=1 Tax=Epidermidibacterium keratini TaxID=1891644 RepID=A0A7L4YQG1_9ACTN|nr:hypothetical protein [Epidermidibacterium keratini]QHC01308.1 hypothetical protein EK0264_14130 [Epidermidibacterium keratini]